MFRRGSILVRERVDSNEEGRSDCEGQEDGCQEGKQVTTSLDGTISQTPSIRGTKDGQASMTEETALLYAVHAHVSIFLF